MKDSKNKVNFLINESSPYLQQHAYNPVEWHPWGEEALKKAKEQDKPILVSIGYSTCHCCHVMERESFEDEKVEAQSNKILHYIQKLQNHFLSGIIKVSEITFGRLTTKTTFKNLASVGENQSFALKQLLTQSLFNTFVINEENTGSGNLDDKKLAFVVRKDFTCSLPVFSVEDALKLL
jgi:hypothetical protein